jgi:UTP-glucose-1-phosphate uridylyltransferase
MAMNGLQSLVAALESTKITNVKNVSNNPFEIIVPEQVRSQAHACVERMLDFVKQHKNSKLAPLPSSSLAFVPHIGVA